MKYIKFVLAALLFFSLPVIAQQSAAGTSTPTCSFTVDTIAGPKNACAYMGATGSSATYSVAATDAQSYLWIIPAGSTGFTGQGTNTISFKYPDNFVSGVIRVIVTSACDGSTITKLDTITKVKPVIPGTISGSNNACPYLGTGTEVVYTIAAVPNAISYLWTAPVNAIITRGQGTRTIAVIYDQNYLVAGYIKVRSVSGCGSSSDKTLKVNIIRPVAPALINGPTNPCPFIGTTTEAIYSIKPVINATEYFWTMPAGATATHPNGAGQNDTIVNVIYDTGFISNTNISVQSSSPCGTSGKKNLTIKRIQPPTPGLISGPTNACPLMISATNPTGTTATYTIYKVPLALGFTWTAPAGATIVQHPGGVPGSIDDTTIVVLFDASFIGSSLHPISVISTNGCGNSAVRNFTVSRLIPSTPGIVSGPTDPCPWIGSVDGALYTIKKVANATSYTWAAPAGATIRSHPGGLGTIDDTTIIVDYTTAFTTGNIQVTAHNNCWTSGTKLLPITRKLPTVPGTITATAPTACPNRQVTYSIPSVPLNIVSLVWTVPDNAILISGQGTTSITVQYPDIALIDTVSITGSNNCQSLQKKLVVNLPACAGLIANAAPAARISSIQQPVVEATDKLRVTLFPNPSISDVTLVATGSSAATMQVRVMDMTGRTVQQFSILPMQATRFGSVLKAGTYLVEIRQGVNMVTEKLLKF